MLQVPSYSCRKNGFMIHDCKCLKLQLVLERSSTAVGDGIKWSIGTFPTCDNLYRAGLGTLSHSTVSHFSKPLIFDEANGTLNFH